VQTALDSFFNFLPNILGFLIILLIGWLIAKAVKALVTKGLEAAGLDRSLQTSSAGTYVQKVSPNASPSRLIGTIVFWFIFLFALSAAIAALKIPALTDFIRDVEAFLPNLVAAVLIFVVAAALAGAAAAAIGRLMEDSSTGHLLQAIVPGVILAIGGFMVLDQLQIAPQIVTITYAGLIALLVLAGGLAFGLGGRDVASEMLREAHSRSRNNEDWRRARERARANRSGRFASTPEGEPSSTSTVVTPTTTPGRPA
jgi:hypothetical protein